MFSVHHAIEMAMDLVIIPTTLVQKRELKECPDIGTLTCQCGEEWYIGGIILVTLAVVVEVDGLGVAANDEGIGCDELSDPHPFH